MTDVTRSSCGKLWNKFIIYKHSWFVKVFCETPLRKVQRKKSTKKSASTSKRPVRLRRPGVALMF